MLIATRALLGVAGATLAPSTLSLIRSMFLDPGQRTFAIGVWVTSYSVGGAIGPLLGGILLQYFWWGSVFLIGVPVMVLLLVVGPLLLPEFRDPDAGRMDLSSAAMSLVAILAVIYGIKQMAEVSAGWRSALAVVAGVAIGALFVRRQRSLADPLIDLGLFRDPAFSASLAAYTLGTFVAFGSLRLHRAVPAARPRPVAARGRAVDRSLDAQLRRGLDDRAQDRAARASGVRDGRRAGAGRARVRRPHRRSMARRGSRSSSWRR